MAFSRIVGAGALGFAALHHALEKRAFAEIPQVVGTPALVFENVARCDKGSRSVGSRSLLIVGSGQEAIR
jgi:hypothetical protein